MFMIRQARRAGERDEASPTAYFIAERNALTLHTIFSREIYPRPYRDEYHRAGTYGEIYAIVKAPLAMNDNARVRCQEARRVFNSQRRSRHKFRQIN